jgi:hypothetical protein
VEGALISFNCSFDGAVPPASQTTDYTGSVTVVVPSNCGQLTFSASAPGFENLDSIVVTEDYFSIEFAPDEESVGTVRVNVFSNGNPVDGVNVKLYRYFEQELGPIETNYSASGLVTFNHVYPGDYIVKTEATELYSAAESSVFTLAAQAEETVTLDLEQKIIGSISVKIVDQSTKIPLSTARVTLNLRGRELAQKVTDTNGIVTFHISEDVGHEIVADHDDYLVKVVTNVMRNTAPIAIEVEKYVPGVNGGILEVFVVNDLGDAVPSATVGLFNADTNVLMPYFEQISDLNGIARFEKVENGNYRAFAFKKQSSGWSETAFFDKRRAEETKLTAIMQIDEGTVEVHVVDEEGDPVNFARVAVYDALGDILQGSDFSNAEGIYTLNLKADKEVYIRASREQAIFYTAAKPVLASSVQTFNVMLPKRMAPDPIEVEFKGLYKDDQTVTNVAPGEVYTARFWVKITEGTDYDEVGLHVRTGDSDIMEKDSLFIKRVNIPQTLIEKDTAFTGDYETDIFSFTYGDAKWFDAFWDHPLHGIYEAEVDIEIKPSATLDEALIIYFKVYGATESFVERDPFDESPADYEMYNNTKQVIRQVGVPTYCDDEFCFDAQIFDNESKILTPVSTEFFGKAFGSYNLKFNLVNNSETGVHNNAFIRITNPEKNLWFTDYTLSNSETGSSSGTLNGYRFTDYSVGNFTPKKIVSGDIDFLPQRAGTGIINIQLISDFQKVKEINLAINSEATKDLDVTIKPEELPSGIENTVRMAV